MMTPTLETKRLILRPASLDDCAELQPLFAADAVREYMVSAIPHPYPDDGMLSFTRDKAIPDMQRGKAHTWTIFNRETGQRMGRTDLNPNELSSPTSEHRGYWIGVPFQRKGYVGEALAATANYGFEILGMPLMTSRIAAANEGSNRLQVLSGATIIKEDLDNYLIGRVPMAVWELRPEPWRASPLRAQYS